MSTTVCSSGRVDPATGECIDGEWGPGVVLVTDWDAVPDEELPANVAVQLGRGEGAGKGKGKGKVNAGKAGRAMADCAWCQYGKPAAAGALVGAGLAWVAGVEPTRGALYGGAAGLAYGAWRG